MIKTRHCPNCEATKQELSDYKQDVSNVVKGFVNAACDDTDKWENLKALIIPKPEPDPLVEVLHEVDTGPEWDSPEDYCNKIRAALDACGYEIRAKNDDQ